MLALGTAGHGAFAVTINYFGDTINYPTCNADIICKHLSYLSPGKQDKREKNTRENTTVFAALWEDLEPFGNQK